MRKAHLPAYEVDASEPRCLDTRGRFVRVVAGEEDGLRLQLRERRLPVGLDEPHERLVVTKEMREQNLDDQVAVRTEERCNLLIAARASGHSDDLVAPR